MVLVDDHTQLRNSEVDTEFGVTKAGTEGDSVPAEAVAFGEVPRRLGHYVLLSKLGQGGMGVVHAAYDETLDRKVAIKLLRTSGDRKAKKRLLREAQSLAKLSHPNVVQIYEAGNSGEQLLPAS